MALMLSTKIFILYFKDYPLVNSVREVNKTITPVWGISGDINVDYGIVIYFWLLIREMITETSI